MSSQHHHGFGWVDGERVPLVLPSEVVWPEGEAETAEGNSTQGAWWPSESVRRVYLSELSRGQAGQVSDWARRELVYWLAGDGLHPVRWMRRWVMALWHFLPGMVPASARTLLTDPESFERAAIGALFPRARYESERARINGVWRGLGAKCQVRAMACGIVGDLEDGARALEGCGWEGPEVDARAAEAEAGEVARLALGNLMRWLAADGAWCLGALKRFYVAVFVDYKDLAPGMTGEDWGALYDQTRAAFCEDAKRYIGLPLEAELGYRPKVAGQKRAEAAEAYAENARLHCPRRQLGAEAHEEEDRRRRSAEEEARIASARAKAEARQLQKDAAEMEAISIRNRERRRGNDQAE